MSCPRKLWAVCVLWLCLLPTLSVAQQVKSNLVVFHINSGHPEAQHSALRNLDNHIEAVGTEGLDLRVVLQGGGVTLLLLPESLARFPDIKYANAGPDFQQRITALRRSGVIFLVSGQYLRKHAIDPARDLYQVEPEHVIDNALAYLSMLQGQGYAYIKP